MLPTVNGAGPAERFFEGLVPRELLHVLCVNQKLNLLLKFSYWIFCPPLKRITDNGQKTLNCSTFIWGFGLLFQNTVKVASWQKFLKKWFFSL